MCGIAGFYGPYGKAELSAMMRALAHRGPDAEGIDIRPGVAAPDCIGLGHRRLSIIDLAGGQQPMWTADGSIGIVFNGEIYNYRELRRDLEGEGGQFRTASDTEVIIEGWRLRGPGILPALAGMFAFGLWDARTRRWIYARDRAGIKPLYYAMPRPDTLVFASEIKPLLPLLPRITQNLGAIYDFLLYSWTPGPETVFAGVKHLPPGHWISWAPGEGEPRPSRYAARRFTCTDLDFGAAAHELRNGFDRAVQSHLVADVPVGVALSGGLDSSAVLASMARLQPEGSIDAFTVAFGLRDDETPFARQMAAHVGVRHHVGGVSRERIAEDFAKIIRIIEEPIAHPVLQTTFEMAKLVREQRKVVLIGEGSDELFLGYPHHRLLTPPFCFAPRSVLRKIFLATACLMPAPDEVSGMLQPSVFDRVLFDASKRRFETYFQDGDFTVGGQAFEFDNPMVANQLMRIDKLTMAQGLEARVPFLDNDFVDFAFSLPVSFRRRGGAAKTILREAMAQRLPPAIVHRPKTGKGGSQALLPYLNELLTQGPLADLVSRKTIERRGWLNPDLVFRYLAGGRHARVRYNPVESRRRLKFTYALAVLEQWAREYLDKAAA